MKEELVTTKVTVGVTGDFVVRWRLNIINNLQTQETRDWEDIIEEMLEEVGLKVIW